MAKLALQRLAHATSVIRSSRPVRRRCFPLNPLQSAYLKEIGAQNSEEPKGIVCRTKKVTIKSDGAQCVQNVMAARARLRQPPTVDVKAAPSSKAAGKEEASCAAQSSAIEREDLADSVEMSLPDKMDVLVQSPLVKARHVHQSCINSIAKKLSVHRFHAGDLIVQHGSVGKDIYWIASGECVCEVNGQAVDRLSAGFCFGEISVIKLSKLIRDGVPEEDAMNQCRRQADVLAASDVVVLKLAYSDSTTLIRIVPNLWMTLEDLSAARTRRIDNFMERQLNAEGEEVDEDVVVSGISRSMKRLSAEN
eukprot:754673-Hanusia_phi.AAC.4